MEISIDKKFVISLKRRNDRLQIFRERCDQLNVDNFNLGEVELFEAVDGKEVKPTEYMVNLFRNNNFNFRCGVVGCALSHFYLIQKIVESKLDHVLIFEDDVTFLPDFIKKYEIVLKNVPEDYDILYIGGNPELGGFRHIGSINDYVGVANDDYGYGTYSYILSLEGAKKIIKFINKKGIQRAVDDLFRINCDTLNIYCTLEKITYSPVVGETDIQNDFTSILQNK